MINTDIFFVEDDPDFAFIMENAIAELDSDVTIQIIENGKEALDILKELIQKKNKPKLILLDLNLPGISGIDLLKEIRDLPYLRYVPVLLFSTSDNAKDVKASLEFGANAYVTKPAGFAELVACLQTIYDFWFTQHANLD